MYEDVQDRETFYRILANAIEKSPLLCHEDVLMGNHYHLFLEGPIEAVSTLMWRVNHQYAVAYNTRHGRINHLLGRRFHCTPIADRRGARAVAVYIALNPVRAGFSEHPSHWRFSSYAAHEGTVEPRPHLSTKFMRDLFGPGETLAGSCETAMGRPSSRPPLEDLLPVLESITWDHVRQAMRIFGYAFDEIARHYGVSVRTLYRWLAAN